MGCLVGVIRTESRSRCVIAAYAGWCYITLNFAETGWEAACCGDWDWYGNNEQLSYGNFWILPSAFNFIAKQQSFHLIYSRLVKIFCKLFTIYYATMQIIVIRTNHQRPTKINQYVRLNWFEINLTSRSFILKQTSRTYLFARSFVVLQSNRSTYLYTHGDPNGIKLKKQV